MTVSGTMLRSMGTISETLAREKDSHRCFISNQEVIEFLNETGLADHLNKKPQRNRAVYFMAYVDHPTHYLLAMRTWDLVDPKENQFMLTCIPKSAETKERFMEFCHRTVKKTEEDFNKLCGRTDAMGVPRLDNPQ